jgi:hypothetical protein
LAPIERMLDESIRSPRRHGKTTAITAYQSTLMDRHAELKRRLHQAALLEGKRKRRRRKAIPNGE